MQVNLFANIFLASSGSSTYLIPVGFSGLWFFISASDASNAAINASAFFGSVILTFVNMLDVGMISPPG